MNLWPAPGNPVAAGPRARQPTKNERPHPVETPRSPSCRRTLRGRAPR